VNPILAALCRIILRLLADNPKIQNISLADEKIILDALEQTDKPGEKK